MSKYPMIAAAVAAAVSSLASAAPALPLTATPTASIVMAGSSAAAPAVASFVENTLCGGSTNTTVVTSSGGTKNFLAYACNIKTAISDPTGSGPTIAAGGLVEIYYRTEGGSVVGALPIAANHNILRLNLANSTCTGTGPTGATCTVTGATTNSGLNDTWAGAVVSDAVQLGVTDVEPAQLTGADYPTNYNPSAFGTATAKQMAALSTAPLFQQVFGLLVNTSGEQFSSVNLSKESAANILLGLYSDWNSVPDAATGQPVSPVSAPIVKVDREPGSGTRTSANIYFLNYQCGSSSSLPTTSTGILNFSTGDEMTLANATAGSISYASIDNLLTAANIAARPNLVLAKINGVTPSNLAAAAGGYDYWFEATLVKSPRVSGTSTTATLSDYLAANLPDLSTAPQSPDINVIPFLTANNNATVPLTSNGAAAPGTVYVNPYTRGSASCNVPAEQN